ncbi:MULTISPECIES: MobC family replication-relaxation protein [Vibrio]|jgi:hypothetical protein|uniref:MobC family replication-relaxation protein n=1 Tax=Vibrio TaxID=662 RepID=UPI00015426F5|nr:MULTISPECIES: MobC family replication-relaxation protein [Vibrio]EDL52171.1 mobilization protein [Vibrio mediterranei AK1]KFA96692.1 hypothetical protein HW45_18950 [Vibrio sp. ER1A]
MTKLPSPAEAKRRGEEKERMIVDFLSEEVYSDLVTLMRLVNVTDERNMRKFLKRLESKCLIKKETLVMPTGKISLWGITDTGLMNSETLPHSPQRVFEPYLVKFATLNHTLMRQRVQIDLTNKGWTGWRNGDRQSFKNDFKVDHRPDAIVTTPDGTQVAIEVELSLKTPHRYRSILKSHITAREKGYWKFALYIVANEKAKLALNRAFERVEYIQFGESRYSVDSYRKELVRIFKIEDVQHIK